MREFARVCGVEYQSLWRYANQNVEPGVETLAKIAKATGTTTDWFISGAGRGPRTTSRAA